jgi:5-methylcytosine-specific restriction endonuclease McrA
LLDMKRRPNSHCVVCSLPIYRRPVQIQAGAVFCSRRCCGLHQRQSHLCRICGTKYEGNKKTCSRACANKTRTGMKYLGDNSKNKARNGNLLKQKVATRSNGACQRCGEKNYSILQVHHKIERYKGGSDTMDNLELLCPNCHATHHLGFELFE